MANEPVGQIRHPEPGLASGFFEPDSVGRSRLPAVPDALLTLGLAAAAIIVSAALLGFGVGLTATFWVRAAVFCLLTAALIFSLVASQLAPAPFGPANRLTAFRALGAALLAGFIGESGSPTVAWLIIGVTIALLVLDGFDGWLARRSGQVSAFGARFDMETDAALTLILAVLCWQFEKAGIWILLVGLMRYAFAGAAYFAPWMARPLPYSRRRQTICVLQLSGLLAVLSPLFPLPASSLAGVVTVLLLAASFAIDIRWLARAHRLTRT